jgi:6-oxo-cyclohex-1-ene-carbonyl-CoA hydrolase
VYGEFKRGDDAAKAKELIKSSEVDLGGLDNVVNGMVWRLANLFPGCLQMSIDQIRTKKKFFWDQAKQGHRHWLAANMMGEAFLGFTAFSTRKKTGKDVIDFIKYRQLIAQGAQLDDAFFEDVLPSPE